MSTWAGAYGATPANMGSTSAKPMQRSTSSDDNRPSRKPQSRQLLSCTKCRERKVKCDRTQPCIACCARGHPRDCEFLVGEGNDYGPIQQSYEIRKLRQENQRLKERLQAAKLSHSADESDEGDVKPQGGAGHGARQKRFKTGDRVDNIYFGTPGLANIVQDFADLRLPSTHSLTHTLPMPKPHEIYTPDSTSHPFPILADWTGPSAIANLVTKCLPPRAKLFSILDSFHRRAQCCSFPHTPDEATTKKEIARFLEDAEGNAARYPDMLALIFATLATGLQVGEWDGNGGRWVEGSMAKTTVRGDVFLAASMQALRLSSFMNSPTLLGIQTLLLIGPYLTNSGRFLDAWTLFGTTIRLAQSIGLHRNPQVLDPAPPLRESMLRRTLWWWMLHMDQHYSVTLGRPLGISGIGDCPAPEPLATNPTILRLGEFVDHFTILARQILSSDGMMNVSKIDDFTDKLVGLWDTMPVALQFNELWLQQDTVLPDWPLEVMSATLYAQVHSFLILLNRQRVERTQSQHPSARQTSPSPPATLATTADHPFHAPPQRGRGLVIDSSCALLNTFLFFHHRAPAVLVSWTMGQQAFNAAMILLIDTWETGNAHHEWLVNEAHAVFAELATKGVHRLAALAVQRITGGLAQLELRRQQRNAASSRRSSGQLTHDLPPHPDAPPVQLQIDTAALLPDWSAASETVMSSHASGMFLLEDPGLQTFTPQPFQPLDWNMAGKDFNLHLHTPLRHPPPHQPPHQQQQQQQPQQPYPHPSSGSHPPANFPPPIPVSQVTAAPFPVISPGFISGVIPGTNSPYAVGLQPRMPTLSHQQHPRGRGTFARQQHPMPYLPPQQPPPPLPPSQQQQQQQQQQFTPINPGLQPPMQGYAAQRGMDAHQAQLPRQQTYATVVRRDGGRRAGRGSATRHVSAGGRRGVSKRERIGGDGGGGGGGVGRRSQQRWK